MAPNGTRRNFVPSNPDLADILGRKDVDFENLYFSHVLDPTVLDFQVRFPAFQSAPLDKLSDPNLTPLPTHPGALAATSLLFLSCLGIGMEMQSTRLQLQFDGMLELSKADQKRNSSHHRTKGSLRRI